MILLYNLIQIASSSFKTKTARNTAPTNPNNVISNVVKFVWSMPSITPTIIANEITPPTTPAPSLTKVLAMVKLVLYVSVRLYVGYFGAYFVSMRLVLIEFGVFV